MFRDLSALASCSETNERQTEEEGVHIHSHFAEGLFPYLFKHAGAGELFIPLSPCTVHLHCKYKTSHPCFYLSTVKMYLRIEGGQIGDTSEQGFLPRGMRKTTLLAAKQMQRSLVNLCSESRVVIVSEL